MTLPRFGTRSLLAALLLACQAAALATPPSHAPAHGWRKQHDPSYQGYTGKKWDQDYGITAGTCHREAVGAVLGAVVGGAVGSQIGKGDGNKVAIVVGTALGALLGAQVGRDMDRNDAACIGHALELARDGQKVSWKDDAGTAYRLKPLRGSTRNGLPCRTFELTVAGKTRQGEACQTAPGTWEVR
ncbi:MAG: glycine zipper domain-containing protein [Pseudomonadota bacterium]